jgi:acyl-CoA thioesterase FadM
MALNSLKQEGNPPLEPVGQRPGPGAAEIVEHVRVEYPDTDAGGAAHARCALLWAERAEHALLRSVGLPPRFPRRRVEIDYLAPVAYGDIVEVRIRVAAVGRTSVTFVWSGHHNSTVCFTGRTVAVSMADGRPAPVPDALAELCGRLPEPGGGSTISETTE